MEWGETEERLRALPVLAPALMLKPELSWLERYYYQAFQFLSGSRRIGMAAGPIPLSEIKAWCDMSRDDDYETMMVLISTMDSEYLKWQSTKLASG